ncbi:M56 family peptidase [Saccharophagus sp. K07]|jgi:TonB family protein|uniref:M56 family metallopeptidase n=1 Tax=Saccharophagus sp. K07 TaxID=2283636 RepID=UPI0016525311|nr:M56 family metallopeptidase [Saccharophagus sp. K07]MBC6905612.1 M56 family peptidase [Saccharophagus sp. K07]
MEIDVLNQVFGVLLKAWILVATALLLVDRSRNSSAGTLHSVLLVVLLGVGAVPLLNGMMPVLHISILPPWAELKIQFSFAREDINFYFSLAAICYFAVICLLWAKRFLQVLFVIALGCRAKRLDIADHVELVKEISAIFSVRRSIDLRYSDHVRTPLTYGVFRPVILMPRESLLWRHDRVRRFLLHEMAHIARHDWLAKFIGYCVAACFWIIPSVWVLQRKLEWLAELACDDKVITIAGRRTDYADDLLALTSEVQQPIAGAVALTEAGSHFDRISAVLDGSRIRQTSQVKFCIYSLTYCAALLLCSSVKLSPIAANSETEYEFYSLKTMPIVADAGEEGKDFNFDDRDLLQHEIQKEILSVADVSYPFDLEARANIYDRNLDLGRFDMELMQVITIIPEYPPEALKKAQKGVVELEFSVLPDGRTTDVRVLRSEPKGVFDKVAINAVRHYRFTPRAQTTASMTKVFEFKLLEDAK